MVPTRRRPSTQGIKCPTVHSGHIPATSHRRVYATPPPALQELRKCITDAYASVSPAMLYNVQQEVQSHVQMCIVAEGHLLEHDR
ncbi:hypothetical protein AVEN_207527-1 [Araneus ventricosus]|uniref:DUF4817 domain-containing protein n=1 Tax=Araneus ventricosus TaxID=182803 RepID=A0A4Y1ZLD1_ARAVE|nr:hypothetical protein AVEN_114645-1 [Araneus ventricosus]GBL56530.1 hypothetical protein AVEN_207527-1 [Araneus ventricosus]